MSETLDYIESSVSVPRAAAMLGIKTTAMHELLDGGAIPCFVPLKQRRVRVADVLEYRNRKMQRGQTSKLTLTEDLLRD